MSCLGFIIYFGRVRVDFCFLGCEVVGFGFVG